jgi:hypothetical protein
VVRENEVLASEVQVEAGAEQLHAHGAALDVPAGSAVTPWARPAHHPIVGHTRFPQGEVARGFLVVLIGGDAFAGRTVRISGSTYRRPSAWYRAMLKYTEPSDAR